MGRVVAQSAGCCEAEFENNVDGEAGKVYLRVVRSTVLVVKVCLHLSFVNHVTYALLIRCQVLSIPHIYLADPVGEMRPRVGIVVLLLGATVAETAVEYDPWDRGVAISLGLALTHVWC